MRDFKEGQLVTVDGELDEPITLVLEGRETMQGPDGTVYQNLVTYTEIAPPAERQVHQHGTVAKVVGHPAPALEVELDLAQAARLDVPPGA